MTALEMALNGMTPEEKDNEHIKAAVLSERVDTCIDYIAYLAVAGGVAYVVGRHSATATINLINKFL